MLFSRAVIQRRDQRAKTISNETTTHFAGTREFTIVRVQFFVQDEPRRAAEVAAVRAAAEAAAAEEAVAVAANAVAPRVAGPPSMLPPRKQAATVKAAMPQYSRSGGAVGGSSSLRAPPSEPSADQAAPTARPGRKRSRGEAAVPTTRPRSTTYS